MSTSPALPALFCLHALGVSKAEFTHLADRLGGEFEVVAIDLPGFGGESAASGTSVEEMAAFVTRTIRAHGSAKWMLLGHSMGGKIASIVAARTLAGTSPIVGLAGVVLLAASPPTPEPMPEEKREQMIGWALDGPLSESSAREFIDANVGAPLAPADDAAALADLQRAAPEAWRAWFERGSREDWSVEVGELRMPALIVSGGADGDLGPDTQRDLNGRVYPEARFEVLDGAGHLLPLERPTEVADLIRGFWRDSASRAPIIPADYAALIASPRTSERTRGILARRALPDAVDAAPHILDDRQLETLRAVADRVVPQEGEPIDLALRLDSQLAAGGGDGWRNADLPADGEAYRQALDQLGDFASLDADAQDARLEAVAEGTSPATGAPSAGTPGAGSLSAAQMTAWFEDARADLIRLWLAHPASLARIGFDGFANGGDGLRKQGYELLGAGEREAWEPAPPVALGLPTRRDAATPSDTAPSTPSATTSSDTTTSTTPSTPSTSQEPGA